MNSHLSYKPHLGHEVLIHRNRMPPASKWLEKEFGRMWHPLENCQGRWTMVWAGHDGNFSDLTDFDKYKVCFADKQDLAMFMLECQ